MTDTANRAQPRWVASVRYADPVTGAWKRANLQDPTKSGATAKLGQFNARITSQVRP